MQVAVYQTSPELLNVEKNMEDVTTKIQEGRKDGAELIVFPELALTGYFVGQKYHEVALRMDSREIKRLANATKGTAAVIGFIEESRSMNFYNSALVAVDGEVLFAYRKLNLPNYGVFEERKYFSSGKRIPVFRLSEFNVAVFICNDLWHPSLPYLGVVQKADIFVSIFNSSQGSMGSEFSNIESWEIINKFYSRIFGIYNICANRVGDENFREAQSLSKAAKKTAVDIASPETACIDKVYSFWGGSEVVNPFGQIIAKAAYHQTDNIITDVSRELVRRKRLLLPYLRNDDPHFTYRQLRQILHKEKEPQDL